MYLKKIKHSCLNCHFFAKECGQNTLWEVPQTERDFLTLEELNSIRSSLRCYFGVWDEGSTPPNKTSTEWVKEMVKIDRKNSCFFWKFHSGMLFPAAKILQEREANNREASKDRRLIIWGLWISAIGLIVPVIKTIAGTIINIFIK